jgi:alkanesulfonate monooxygenase SsuD/methylene tetrahydromethanopterin reductase-like flavin-dependent oxidoreductase (luciferase family)
MESIDTILRIWAQDPPYDIQGEFWNVQIKKAILPELGVGFMPKPLQKPHPPIHISIASPDSASAKLAGSKGWGVISGPVAPRYAVANHWRAYSEARRAAGKMARSEDWRVSRLMIVAPTDAEARERVYGEHASNRYYCSYMRRALEAAKRLSMIKPRPEMTDDECTADSIIEECVVYGSPRTVLDKLVHLREQVGPFGALLQIGLDWSGPNEAWERDGMRLLAQDVMPKFRQHVTAQAAE